jgi:hypothetical protein
VRIRFDQHTVAQFQSFWPERLAIARSWISNGNINETGSDKDLWINCWIKALTMRSPHPHCPQSLIQTPSCRTCTTSLWALLYATVDDCPRQVYCLLSSPYWQSSIQSSRRCLLTLTTPHSLISHLQHLSAHADVQQALTPPSMLHVQTKYPSQRVPSPVLPPVPPQVRNPTFWLYGLFWLAEFQTRFICPPKWPRVCHSGLASFPVERSFHKKTIQVEFSAIALDTTAGQFKVYHRHMISYWVS